MVKSNTSIDEAKRLTLIDTLGQLQALISAYFMPKNSDENCREKFYIGMLLDELVSKLKSLIDDMLLHLVK